MSQEWYYSVGGEQKGPVSAAELKKLADAGQLSAADLVWKDGMADWVPAKTIKGLFASGNTSQVSTQPAKADKPAAKPAPVDEADEDDRPRSKAGSKAEEPAKKSGQADFDFDNDADEDDRPKGKSKRRYDDDEEDERPKSKSGAMVKRDRDDDGDDDDYKPKKKGKSRPGFNREEVKSKKMTAGLLAIFLGAYGVHKFYLGMSGPAIIHILACCGGFGIINLIEGIIYLTKSEEEFYDMYIVGKKGWF